MISNTYSCLIFLVVGLVCLVLPHPSEASCWNTGCIPESSEKGGCQQYNLTEEGKEPCEGGFVYNCCTEDGGNEIAGWDIKESVSSSCWETGCHSEDWLKERGCAMLGYAEVARRPCDDEGYISVCCNQSTSASDTKNAIENSPANSHTGDLTYYNLGLTACGRVYTDQDMVVALAFGHFTTPNPNVDPICGRKIRITDPQSNSQIVVEVEDKCAGCQMEDVDVSPAAFQQLRPLGVGRFKVTWDFI